MLANKEAIMDALRNEPRTPEGKGHRLTLIVGGMAILGMLALISLVSLPSHAIGQKLVTAPNTGRDWFSAAQRKPGE
jgi:hypothetical protein